jgi:hypothetical protein
MRQRGGSPYYIPRGVEVKSALAKTDHPVGVVEILMMNHSYHVSYFNSFHPHSAQFS